MAGLGWAGRYIVKTLGLTVKRTWWNPHAQNLIGPVVYGDFCGHFRKIALKSIKKALGFPLKVDGVSRLCKMSKKHWS